MMYGVEQTIDYRLLICLGCETPFFQTDHVFSENMDHRRDPATGEWEPYLPHKLEHWPSPLKRDRPSWYYRISLQDRPLGALLDDVYGALDADLKVPAAVATRTVFDRASELLGIDPAISFEEKLKELQSARVIGENEKLTLGVLTDAGNAAAHRGWQPDDDELSTLVSITESFLHRSFVLPEDAKALADSVPKRPKRRQKKLKIAQLGSS